MVGFGGDGAGQVAGRFGGWKGAGRVRFPWGGRSDWCMDANLGPCSVHACMPAHLSTPTPTSTHTHPHSTPTPQLTRTRTPHRHACPPLPTHTPPEACQA